MERPQTFTHETVADTPLASARVLLGTIAATGTLALTSVLAAAPTRETILILAALALPWITVALAIGLAHFVPSAMAQPDENGAAPVPHTGHPMRTLRLVSPV